MGKCQIEGYLIGFRISRPARQLELTGSTIISLETNEERPSFEMARCVGFRRKSIQNLSCFLWIICLDTARRIIEHSTRVFESQITTPLVVFHRIRILLVLKIYLGQRQMNHRVFRSELDELHESRLRLLNLIKSHFIDREVFYGGSEFWIERDCLLEMANGFLDLACNRQSDPQQVMRLDLIRRCFQDFS